MAKSSICKEHITQRVAILPQIRNQTESISEKLGEIFYLSREHIDMLKSGGRMAIVLPQGRFNNSSDKYIREFISERCRILAVIGLTRKCV